jgi:hypothetical protein
MGNWSASELGIHMNGERRREYQSKHGNTTPNLAPLNTSNIRETTTAWLTHWDMEHLHSC